MTGIRSIWPCRASAGFTFIEMLAVITILMGILIFIGMIYSEVDRVWFLGTDSAKSSTLGRAAIDLIAHDLRTTVTDTNMAFYFDFDRETNTTYGVGNHELMFVAIPTDLNNSNRCAVQIGYWVRTLTNRYLRHELVRGYVCITNPDAFSPDHCYDNPSWFLEPDVIVRRSNFCAVVAEQVAAFRLLGMTTGGLTLAYNSMSNEHQLPVFLDVYLELLPERHAQRSADMVERGLNITNYVEQHTRRFTTRVHFNQRFSRNFRGR